MGVRDTDPQVRSGDRVDGRSTASDAALKVTGVQGLLPRRAGMLAGAHPVECGEERAARRARNPVRDDGQLRDGLATLPEVAFQPGALHPGPSQAGEIDYRLARRRLLAAFRAGRVSRPDICDAHPELRRAGAEVGTPTRQRCPVCDDAVVSHVTYVFGPRLPAFGRCVTSTRELQRLAQRKGEHTAYVVEVCPECAWNHLVRAYLLAPGRDT